MNVINLHNNTPARAQGITAFAAVILLAFAVSTILTTSVYAQPKGADVLLEDQLPDPATLQDATGDMIVEAVRMACRLNTDRAPEICAEALAVDKVRNLDAYCPIVKAAIEGVTPPGGQADPDLLKRIFEAAIRANPERALQIAQCCEQAAPYFKFEVPPQDQPPTEEIPTSAFLPIPTVPQGSLPGPGGGGGEGGTPPPGGSPTPTPTPATPTPTPPNIQPETPITP